MVAKKLDEETNSIVRRIFDSLSESQNALCVSLGPENHKEVVSNKFLYELMAEIKYLKNSLKRLKKGSDNHANVVDLNKNSNETKNLKDNDKMADSNITKRKQPKSQNKKTFKKDLEGSSKKIEMRIQFQMDTEIRSLSAKKKSLVKKLQKSVHAIKVLKNLLDEEEKENLGPKENTIKKSKIKQKLFDSFKIGMNENKKDEAKRERMKKIERSVSEPRNMKFRERSVNFECGGMSNIKRKLKFDKTGEDGIKKKRNPAGNNNAVVINSAFMVLSDKEHNWQERVKKMSLLEDILAEGKTRFSKDQLALLKSVILIQLKDLRSAVIKKTCSLIKQIGNSIPKEISPFLAEFLSSLFTGVFNSKKAINMPCSEAIQTLVKNNLDSFKCIKQLALFCFDSHHEVRELSVLMITLCIDNCKSENAEKFRPLIEDAISKTIRDANGHVRFAAKLAFKAYSKKWSNEYESFVKSLIPSSKKIVCDGVH